MSKLVVEGGARLQGTVGVMGAKNAVLKEMVSALLAPGRHRLTNVPDILDVSLMCEVLEHIGCKVEQWSLINSCPKPRSSWCAGCVPRLLSSGRSWPDVLRLESPFPGAMISVPGPSTCI
jgi:hypothetical protein